MIFLDLSLMYNSSHSEKLKNLQIKHKPRLFRIFFANLVMTTILFYFHYKKIMSVQHSFRVFKGVTEFLDSGHKCWMLDSGPWTLGAGLWMLYSRSWTLDSGRWTLNSRCWTLDAGPWTLGFRLWKLDCGR